MDFRTTDDVLAYLVKHPETKELHMTHEQFGLLMSGIPIDAGYPFAVGFDGFAGQIFGVPVYVHEEDAFIRMAKEYVETHG